MNRNKNMVENLARSLAKNRFIIYTFRMDCMQEEEKLWKFKGSLKKKDDPTMANYDHDSPQIIA